MIIPLRFPGVANRGRFEAFAEKKIEYGEFIFRGGLQPMYK